MLRETRWGESNATTIVWGGTMEKSAFELHPEGQAGVLQTCGDQSACMEV